MKALRKPYGKHPYLRTRFAKGFKRRQARRYLLASVAMVSGYARALTICSVQGDNVSKAVAIAETAYNTTREVNAALRRP